MNFLGVWELGFVVFGALFFFEVSTSFILGGYNFFVFNPFLIIVSVSDATIGGFQKKFGHYKQQSLTFGSSLH
jgi:hypothetical protein